MEDATFVNQFKARTKATALETVRICQALRKSPELDVVTRQLLRAGTSVGANYRSACRSRSDAEISAKLGIVEEEADEAQYWLELLSDLAAGPNEQIDKLHGEFGEIVAIVSTSRRTIKKRMERDGNQPR